MSKNSNKVWEKIKQLFSRKETRDDSKWEKEIQRNEKELAAAIEEDKRANPPLTEKIDGVRATRDAINARNKKIFGYFNVGKGSKKSNKELKKELRESEEKIFKETKDKQSSQKESNELQKESAKLHSGNKQKTGLKGLSTYQTQKLLRELDVGDTENRMPTQAKIEIEKGSPPIHIPSYIERMEQPKNKSEIKV